MSRLLVVVRSSLAPGFHLAGVDAFGVEDVESAQELITGWLDEGESGLVAVEEGILAGLNPALTGRLEASHNLFCVGIPGGKPLGDEGSRRMRIASMIRHAIGIHITLKSETTEAKHE
jgi:vacuolar-type H+-ATPase subunit F/Vma7